MIAIHPGLLFSTQRVNSLLAIQHVSCMVYHTFCRGFLQQREQQLAYAQFFTMAFPFCFFTLTWIAAMVQHLGGSLWSSFVLRGWPSVRSIYWFKPFQFSVMYLPVAHEQNCSCMQESLNLVLETWLWWFLISCLIHRVKSELFWLKPTSSMSALHTGSKSAVPPHVCLYTSQM